MVIFIPSAHTKRMSKRRKKKTIIFTDYATPEAPMPKYTPGSDTPYENMCFINYNGDEDTDCKFD